MLERRTKFPRQTREGSSGEGRFSTLVLRRPPGRRELSNSLPDGPLLTYVHLVPLFGHGVSTLEGNFTLRMVRTPRRRRTWERVSASTYFLLSHDDCLRSYVFPVKDISVSRPIVYLISTLYVFLNG